MKDSFVFYKSFYDSIKKIPEEYQLELYNAIFSYSLDGIEQNDLSPIAEAMFILIKPIIDSSQKRYEASVENGKKGGRPLKKTQEKPDKNLNETQQKPIQNLDETKEKPNKNLNVDDNVDDNDAVDYKYKNKELKKVIDEYENNIAPATATSKEILQSYYNDLGSELIIEAIRRASLANKRNCKYVQGILNSWIRKGYKTLIEVKNEEEEFKNKKNTKETKTNKRGYSNYSQRDPDTIDFNKFYANKPPGETI